MKAEEQKAIADRAKARIQAQQEARDKLANENKQRIKREEKQREEFQRQQEAEAFERQQREREEKQRKEGADNHYRAVDELNKKNKQAKLKSVLTGRKKANEEEALKNYLSKWKSSTKEQREREDDENHERKRQNAVKVLTRGNERWNEEKKDVLGQKFAKWKGKINDIKYEESLDKMRVQDNYEDTPEKVPRKPFTTIRKPKRGPQEAIEDPNEKKHRHSEQDDAYDEWKIPEKPIPEKPFTLVHKKGILETKKEMKKKELNSKSVQRKENLARRLRAGANAAAGGGKQEPVHDYTRMSKIAKALAEDPENIAKLEKSKQKGEQIMREMRKKEKEDLQDQ